MPILHPLHNPGKPTLAMYKRSSSCGVALSGFQVSCLSRHKDSLFNKTCQNSKPHMVGTRGPHPYHQGPSCGIPSNPHGTELRPLPAKLPPASTPPHCLPGALPSDIEEAKAQRVARGFGRVTFICQVQQVHGPPTFTHQSRPTGMQGEGQDYPPVPSEGWDQCGCLPRL